MDYKEYEEFVHEVVKGLSITRNAKIYRDRKYQGLRQPGEYQIDVACEINFDDSLFFLLIVECKNWKRPVGREEIQKFIQTRDAISAHKAAFASPTGYTTGAKELARVHRIELWVIAKGKFEVAQGGGLAAQRIASTMANHLEEYIKELIGYSGNYFSNLFDDRYNLAPASQADRNYSFSNKSGLDYIVYASGSDPVLRLLINHIFQDFQIRCNLTKKIARRLSEFNSILLKAGMSPTLRKDFLKSFVIKSLTGEGANFEKLTDFDSKLNHSSTKLIAPMEWIERKGGSFFIYPSAAGASVGLENNIIWANTIWLLNEEGFLD